MTSEDWEDRHNLSARTRKEFWENIKTTIKNNWLLDTLPLAVIILFFTILFMTGCADGLCPECVPLPSEMCEREPGSILCQE